MYPYWPTQVLIAVLPLLALGTWLYGRTMGLILAFFALIHHYTISSLIYGDICKIYEDRLSGVILCVSVIFLIGKLRNNYDDLKGTNIELDIRVQERSTELVKLTIKLLDDVEATRIRHGQMLHDGIGQQLTGIQLYSASLAEQLLAEINPSASLAFSMRARAEKAHNIIRKTARMLFPVRMRETGLMPAINELASCFNEMKHVSFAVSVDGDFSGIPDKLALSLYRICHESAICAVTGLNASTIHLDITEVKTSYEMTLKHNGTSWLHLNENMEHRLILYRLKSLGGMFSTNQSGDHFENIIYRVPKFV